MKTLATLGLVAVLSAASLSAEIVYRQPLDEAGQSGVCLQGDKLFLTIRQCDRTQSHGRVSEEGPAGQ